MCDYSTDVQSALTAILMIQESWKGPQAATAAFFIPGSEGSESKPLCERNR